MKDTVMKILKYILLIAVTVLFLFPVIYMLACSFMTGSQVSEMLNFSDGKYKELNMIPNMATLEEASFSIASFPNISSVLEN